MVNPIIEVKERIIDSLNSFQLPADLILLILDSCRAEVLQIQVGELRKAEKAHLKTIEYLQKELKEIDDSLEATEECDGSQTENA